jgi:hypothetical protein
LLGIKRALCEAGHTLDPLLSLRLNGAKVPFPLYVGLTSYRAQGQIYSHLLAVRYFRLTQSTLTTLTLPSVETFYILTWFPQPKTPHILSVLCDHALCMILTIKHPLLS